MWSRGSKNEENPAPPAPAPVLVTVEHIDPYEAELGPGQPLYDDWVIEADGSSSSGPAARELYGDTCFRAAPYGASGDGDGDGGKGSQLPASTELWRFRQRGCQDCWAALLFIGVVGAMLLLGCAELWHFELTSPMVDNMHQLVHPVSASYAATAPGADVSVRAAGAGGGGAKQKKHTPELQATYADGAADAGVIGSGPRGALQGLRILLGADHPWAEEEGQDAGASNSVVGSSGSRVRSVLGAAWAVVQPLLWCAASLLAALAGLALMRAAPRALITASIAVQAVVLALLALLSLVTSPLSAVLPALGSAASIVWLCLIQDRIPFSAELLATAADIVQHHPALVAVSALAAAASAATVVVALVCAGPSLLRVLGAQERPSDAFFLLFVFFVVLWAQQLMDGLCHTVTSGLVATWYFSGGHERMPPAPVRTSLRRATTTSFGSVCLGTLLVAVVSFLQLLARFASRPNAVDDLAGGDNNLEAACNLFCCVLSCLLDCLGGVLEYFNQYAFVHVAVYGCSYADGGRRTLELCRQCFFAAFFNDALVGPVMSLVAMWVTLAMGLLALLLTLNIASAVYVTLLSACVSLIVLRLPSSAVTALFVCFAELPEALRLSSPRLFELLMEKDGGLTGNAAALGGPDYGTMV